MRNSGNGFPADWKLRWVLFLLKRKGKKRKQVQRICENMKFGTPDLAAGSNSM